MFYTFTEIESQNMSNFYNSNMHHLIWFFKTEFYKVIYFLSFENWNTYFLILWLQYLRFDNHSPLKSKMCLVVSLKQYAFFHAVSESTQFLLLDVFSRKLLPFLIIKYCIIIVFEEMVSAWNVKHQISLKMTSKICLRILNHYH